MYKRQVRLYEVTPRADVARLHRLSVMVARERPYNAQTLRLNALFPSWPRPCATNATSAVAPSTCVALTARLVAASLATTDLALRDDATAFRELGLAHAGRSVLSSFTPLEALEGLTASGVLRECTRRFPARASSSSPQTLPLLSMARH